MDDSEHRKTHDSLITFRPWRDPGFWNRSFRLGDYSSLDVLIVDGSEPNFFLVGDLSQDVGMN